LAPSRLLPPFDSFDFLWQIKVGLFGSMPLFVFVVLGECRSAGGASDSLSAYRLLIAAQLLRLGLFLIKS